MPFFYTGHHLNHFIPGYSELPVCSDANIMHQALEVVLDTDKYSNDCLHAYPCQKFKFEIESMPQKSKYFTLAYADLEVEHYISYISYDTQSLISELGGVVGMFLGLSGVSIGYYFADWIGTILCREAKDNAKKTWKNERKKHPKRPQSNNLHWRRKVQFSECEK